MGYDTKVVGPSDSNYDYYYQMAQEALKNQKTNQQNNSSSSSIWNMDYAELNAYGYGKRSQEALDYGTANNAFINQPKITDGMNYAVGVEDALQEFYRNNSSELDPTKANSNTDSTNGTNSTNGATNPQIIVINPQQPTNNTNTNTNSTPTQTSTSTDEANKKKLQDAMKQLEDNFNKEQSHQGFLGGIWDGIKNTIGGSKDSSNPISRLWSHVVDKDKGSQSVQKTLDTFQEYSDKGDIEGFKIRYKELTGKDLNLDFNKDNVLQGTDLSNRVDNYSSSQKAGADVIADIGTGLVVAAAVAAAPFTGGASLLLAVGVGAATKTALKATDAAVGGRDYSAKDALYDAGTGAVDGALALVAPGAGSKAAEGVATKVGANVVEQTGKEIVEQTGKEVVEQTGKEVIEQTGKEIVEQTGKEAIEQTGKEVIEQTGKEAIEQTGKEVIEQTGKEAVEQAGEETTKRSIGTMVKDTASNAATKVKGAVTKPFSAVKNTTIDCVNETLENGGKNIAIKEGTSLGKRALIRGTQYYVEGGVYGAGSNMARAAYNGDNVLEAGAEGFIKGGIVNVGIRGTTNAFGSLTQKVKGSSTQENVNALDQASDSGASSASNALSKEQESMMSTIDNAKGLDSESVSVLKQQVKEGRITEDQLNDTLNEWGVGNNASNSNSVTNNTNASAALTKEQEGMMSIIDNTKGLDAESANLLKQQIQEGKITQDQLNDTLKDWGFGNTASNSNPVANNTTNTNNSANVTNKQENFDEATIDPAQEDYYRQASQEEQNFNKGTNEKNVDSNSSTVNTTTELTQQQNNLNGLIDKAYSSKSINSADVATLKNLVKEGSITTEQDLNNYLPKAKVQSSAQNQTNPFTVKNSEIPKNEYVPATQEQIDAVNNMPDVTLNDNSPLTYKLGDDPKLASQLEAYKQQLAAQESSTATNPIITAQQQRNLLDFAKDMKKGTSIDNNQLEAFNTSVKNSSLTQDQLDAINKLQNTRKGGKPKAFNELLNKWFTT